MKKRGLSTVIASLIIILLVLVATGIVWAVVKNIISGGVEDVSLEGFTLDLKIKNVNVDNSTNNIYTDVERNPGKGDLVGIKFIFNDGINSEVFENEIIMQEMDDRSFSFILNRLLPIDNVKTLSIAPIYKIGSGKRVIGHIVDTYTIKKGIGWTCTPNCTGKECGSDGCGGSCGTCGTGYYCDSGTCVAGTNPCDLTSASWSHTNVVEGTEVTLNVQGTDCTGIDLNYSIYEDELIGDDFVTSFVAAKFKWNMDSRMD